jgi:(2Fe-2S) ferredoxin
MSKKDKQRSLFNLEGRFLGFIVEDGYKIKYLRLETGDGECCIKLSKEARASVGRVLSPGDWLQVWGENTVKGEGEIKLKAYRIAVITPEQSPAVFPEVPAPQAKSKKSKSAILVCQKSDCMKRGGKAVCKALENALGDRGLTDQVSIQGTGCMKHCKAGPNIVFMPDKTRYSRVSAGDIPALVDQHFPEPQPAASPLAEASSQVPEIHHWHPKATVSN